MSKTIHAAYDKDGKIVAAVAAVPTGGQAESPAGPRPSEGPGVSVGQFEVPAKFAGKTMREYVDLLRVDAATQRLVERQDGDQSARANS
jgi:hypothetical protein